MQKEFEAQYHLLEEGHWWFQGRRQAVHALVLQNTPDRESRILEIGCSGGPLLQQLAADGYTAVTGIDISAEAIELCHKRGLTNTHVMDALRLSFAPGSFDLIIASDVLEHLSDAPQAVDAWQRLLRPGGRLLVFVPAFMFLWSRHDEVNLHFKRYRRPELEQLLQDHGFAVRRSSYWNFWLFFPVTLVRVIKRFLPESEGHAGHGDLNKPPGWINALLFRLLRCEDWLFRAGLNWPWGVSVMVLGQK